MRKPRLSRNTIETLFREGKAKASKYEYEMTQDWNDELNTYIEKLTRWDENNNYEEWEIPANEGVWAFEKK
nr:MAG TPA: hypothetical protein [Microviridae sp.]